MFKDSIQTVTELICNTSAFSICICFPAGSCRFAKPFLHSWDEARNSELERAHFYLSCISDQGEFLSFTLYLSPQSGSDQPFYWNMLTEDVPWRQVNLRQMAFSPIHYCLKLSLSPVAWGRLIRCLLLDRMGESHFSSDGTERRHSGSCMRSGRMAMSLRQWTRWFCTFWLLLWPVDILEIPGNGEKQIPIATCFMFIIRFRRLKEGMLPRFAAIKRNGFFTSRHFYYGPFRLFRLKFSHPRQRNLKEVTYGKI